MLRKIFKVTLSIFIPKGSSRSHSNRFELTYAMIFRTSETFYCKRRVLKGNTYRLFKLPVYSSLFFFFFASKTFCLTGNRLFSLLRDRIVDTS